MPANNKQLEVRKWPSRYDVEQGLATTTDSKIYRIVFTPIRTRQLNNINDILLANIHLQLSVKAALDAIRWHFVKPIQ